MHPLLNIAIRAARKSGDTIRRAFDNTDNIKVSEKAANDYVTNIDAKAEQLIVETIHKSYPDHGIIAEESGESEDSHNKEYQWIIDPLDGTTNFIRGIPHFCISIAVKRKDQVEHAVVYDPIRDELFTASKGQGAQLNDRRIRIAAKKSLNGSIIATGFPFKSLEFAETHKKILNTFFPEHCADIRRAGSAALDLAYLAANRFDGFFEFDLAPWDYAAGRLLIREAGGMSDSMLAKQFDLKDGHILAAHPSVFAIMQKIIKQAV